MLAIVELDGSIGQIETSDRQIHYRRQPRSIGSHGLLRLGNVGSSIRKNEDVSLRPLDAQVTDINRALQAGERTEIHHDLCDA